MIEEMRFKAGIHVVAGRSQDLASRLRRRLDSVGRRASSATARTATQLTEVAVPSLAHGHLRDRLHRTNRPPTPALGQEFHGAWSDLKAHPALRWTPPLWRADIGCTQVGEEASSHVESAIDRNLKVELVVTADGHVQVRLMTGPLKDKTTASGVDPLTPVAVLNPRIAVVAPTFEDAVIELRDAVVGEYGPVDLDGSPV